VTLLPAAPHSVRHAMPFTETACRLQRSTSGHKPRGPRSRGHSRIPVLKEKRKSSVASPTTVPASVHEVSPREYRSQNMPSQKALVNFHPASTASLRQAVRPAPGIPVMHRTRLFPTPNQPPTFAFMTIACPDNRYQGLASASCVEQAGFIELRYSSAASPDGFLDNCTQLYPTRQATVRPSKLPSGAWLGASFRNRVVPWLLRAKDDCQTKSRPELGEPDYSVNSAR